MALLLGPYLFVKVCIKLICSCVLHNTSSANVEDAFKVCVNKILEDIISASRNVCFAFKINLATELQYCRITFHCIEELHPEVYKNIRGSYQVTRGESGNWAYA